MRYTNLCAFVLEAQNKHHNKYNYDTVNYVNNYTKIKIFCYKHGFFLQKPYDHLNGHGCKKCGVEITTNCKSSSIDEFIKKAIKVHGDKFNYSKAVYIKSNMKIEIICLEHGSFLQSPNSHLQGCGCPTCGKIQAKKSMSKSLESFINDAIIIHNDKYDYSKVNYINSFKEINIVCHQHGGFKQKPYTHLSGSGCPKCGRISCGTSLAKPKEFFLNESFKIHANKYDYSLVNYVNNKTNISIICLTHGTVNQTPLGHLNGNGCPLCFESKGEKRIALWLEKKSIKYNRQKRFPELKKMPFDFYLQEYNLCIEYDGIQHYHPVSRFGGENSFKKLQANDNIKQKYCENNSLKLLRINYQNYKNIENILKNELEKLKCQC